MADILTPGAAFDSRTLNAAKLATRQDPQGGLRVAAKQIEGLFVQMMLKSMRDATPKQGMFNSQQGEMFTSMLDQQMSQNLSDNGRLGLAESIFKSLGGKMTPGAGDDAGSAHPVPFSTKPGFYTAVLPQPTAHFPQQSAAEPGPRQPMESDNLSFLSQLAGPAMAVAQKSGIPHQLIMAQAALESGWGRREIPTASGRPSHNLFAIKATPDWKGETTEIMTTEYSNGVAKKVKAAFRVYSSYKEALSDYATLLTRNPRYKKIAEATTPEMGAHALQEGGYATDPDYARKLIGIIKQMTSGINKVATAYKNDLTALF